ncbi:hypothetical protein C8Q76DRAFT_829508 [Earliella scabrosa]|nr:hypothetical protein C8Q76DRAFT_829508 [Earliella scabrosa]
MQLGRNTLTTPTRHFLVLPRRYPTLLPLGSRCNSSTSAGSSQSSQFSASSATLASAVGSLLSGAIACYAASQTIADKTGRNHASAELNNQRGSLEDFKKAIARAAFPDSDAVTTDKEHLEDHGLLEYDYHPGSSPSAVYPTSTEDVVTVVKTAVKFYMLAPRVGKAIAEQYVSAVSCDMDKIIELHSMNPVTYQPRSD